MTRVARSLPPRHGRIARGAPTRAGRAFLVAALFLLALWGLTALGRLPLPVLWTYLGMSALAVIMYARDKHAATVDAWRTAESTLHLLALLGGWPGALWARQLLRHKSSKKPFTRIFRLTIATNLATLGYLLLPPGQRLLADFATLLR